MGNSNDFKVISPNKLKTAEIRDTIGNLKKKLEKYPDEAEISIYCNEDADLLFFIIDKDPIELKRFNNVRAVFRDRTSIIYKGIKNNEY